MSRSKSLRKKNPHDCQVKVWLTEKQDLQYREAAAAADMPLSVFMRTIIEAAMHNYSVEDHRFDKAKDITHNSKSEEAKRPDGFQDLLKHISMQTKKSAL